LLWPSSHAEGQSINHAIAFMWLIRLQEKYEDQVFDDCPDFLDRADTGDHQPLFLGSRDLL